MVFLKGPVLCVISALSLALAAPAQEGGNLQVPGELVVGQDVTISYSNPDLAGVIAGVQVDCGAGRYSVILIQLDDEGEGEVFWHVPDCVKVDFNAPDCAIVTCWIEGSTGHHGEPAN